MDWMKSRDELERQGQDRKLRLLDPRCVKIDSATPKKGDGLNYAKRRERGLCGTGCGRPSDKSRCGLCAERYSKTPARAARYRGKAKERPS